MNLQQLMSQFAGVTAGGAPALGGSTGGALDQLADLQKALTASNYQTDVATLTGGGALGVQSLDTVMKATVQEEEHFVLFKQLGSTNATNIVDEYMRQTSVGGAPGSSFNSQMGVVRAAQGEYSREIGLVKFLMSMRQVGMVLNIGNNAANPMTLEEMNGSKQLLTDAEYALFYGNSAACPVEFDGIFKQIDDSISAGESSPEHVYNMDGAPLDDVKAISNINAAVFDYGSWGNVTDIYLPTAVQTDLNLGLDPAFRWSPNGGNTPMVGAHVDKIRLTNGVLNTHIDTFMHHGDFVMAKPYQVGFSAAAVANAAFKPATVTVATASDASSKFTAPRAGNYYWGVAGIGPTGEGQSEITLTSQTAVAAGEKATLTITKSSGGTETGYAIYRSRKGGTNAAADLRLVKVIAKTAGETTTHVDLNLDIPGTCSVPLLNMKPSADAIGWRQFLPMTKIPLPFGIGGMPVYSWFQFLFGYLRMTKPKHHGYIKNILPTTATWLPFG